MSFEQKETPDPDAGQPRPHSEMWGAWGSGDDEDTQPRPAVSPTPPARGPNEPSSPPANSQFTLREHVTGALPVHPSDAPRFQPAYNPYAQLPPAAGSMQPRAPQGPVPGLPPGIYQPPPGYGYPPPYPGGPSHNGYLPPRAGTGSYYPYPYAYPPYGWQPPRPKRDGFRVATGIVTIVCASLAIMGGLASAFFLALLIILPNPAAAQSATFSSVMTFISFIVAGVTGGIFCLYHSIRSLMNKPSANIRLPWFWIPLVIYLLVASAGYILQVNGLAVRYEGLTIFLIVLAAIFPGLAVASLGARRLRLPTSWRRFTVALVSGATLGIGLALLFELGLTLLAVGTSNGNVLQCISDPSLPGCDQSLLFKFAFLIVAIIGPIVEETVKPLGVAFYIGRIRSAAEAFTLGLAAGVGFALVETAGYIGSGYQDWLTVALERTGASLLHGFGAGMVALGWYYLIHKRQGKSIVIAFLCWLYAVFQHFLWNGTAVMIFLPAPIGTGLQYNVNFGFFSLPVVELLNIAEAILMLVFFIYITGRLRNQSPTPPPAPRNGQGRGSEPSGEPQAVGRV